MRNFETWNDFSERHGKHPQHARGSNFQLAKNSNYEADETSNVPTLFDIKGQILRAQQDEQEEQDEQGFVIAPTGRSITLCKRQPPFAVTGKSLEGASRPPLQPGFSPNHAAVPPVPQSRWCGYRRCSNLRATRISRAFCQIPTLIPRQSSYDGCAQRSGASKHQLQYSTRVRDYREAQSRVRTGQKVLCFRSTFRLLITVRPRIGGGGRRAAPVMLKLHPTSLLHLLIPTPFSASLDGDQDVSLIQCPPEQPSPSLPQ